MDLLKPQLLLLVGLVVRLAEPLRLYHETHPFAVV
jgi:hypothetical protein